MEKSKIKLGGIYKHYKGKKYKVHNFARHSETLEELVFYETLYECEKGQFWVRPLSLFEGFVEIDGKQKERFELIDE